MNLNLKIVSVLVALALLGALAFGVYGAYVMTSPPITINEQAHATLLLTTNSTTFALGDIITLTATCSDITYSGQITFLEGTQNIGSAFAVSGVAHVNVQPTSGSHTYTASATHA